MGESAASTRYASPTNAGDCVWRTNASGVVSRPTTKARLKFSVARVE